MRRIYFACMWIDFFRMHLTFLMVKHAPKWKKKKKKLLFGSNSYVTFILYILFSHKNNPSNAILHYHLGIHGKTTNPDIHVRPNAVRTISIGTPTLMVRSWSCMWIHENDIKRLWAHLIVFSTLFITKIWTWFILTEENNRYLIQGILLLQNHPLNSTHSKTK